SLDSAFREQPVTEIAQPAPDTIKTIKPIITDTAVLKTETNVDSLQKEYERQNAEKPSPATETPPANNNTRSAEPVLESQGKRYSLPKSTIYFYDSPNPESGKRGVLGL